MKVGITGSKGFISTHLKKKLSNTKHEIIEFTSNVKDYIKVQELYNLADKVVHLAGKNRGNEEELFLTNVLGTYNILDCAEKFKKQTIIASSTYNQQSVYRASKQISDTLVKQKQDKGLKIMNYKIPNVIGTGIKPNYNSFPATLCYLVAKNKPYEHLIDNPDNVVNLLDVTILVNDIIDCLIDDSHMLYYMNFTHGERWFTKDETFDISLKEIIEILTHKSDHPKKQIFLDMLEYYKNVE